jgi:hypothetical protein
LGNNREIVEVKASLLYVTYILLGMLVLVSIAFTIWAASPPGIPSPSLTALLPWFLWMAAPYLLITTALYKSRDSIRAVRVLACGALVVGAISMFLMYGAYSKADHSGQLWLVVPLFELLGCILVWITARIVRTFEKNPRLPNQAL